MDSGNVAWILTSSALVALMIPAPALPGTVGVDAIGSGTANDIRL